MDKLDQLHERRGDIVGVATGFGDLDKLTGGLQKSDLIILAARPAVGKCLTAHTLIDDPQTGARLHHRGMRSTAPTAARSAYPKTGEVQTTAISDWIDSGDAAMLSLCARTVVGR